MGVWRHSQRKQTGFVDKTRENKRRFGHHQRKEAGAWAPTEKKNRGLGAQPDKKMLSNNKFRWIFRQFSVKKRV